MSHRLPRARELASTSYAGGSMLLRVCGVLAINKSQEVVNGEFITIILHSELALTPYVDLLEARRQSGCLS